MVELFTGSCACEATRYEVAGEPLEMSHCQCRQCQRDSGTGHGSHLTFVVAPVTVTSEASRRTIVGETGTRKSCAFCAARGAPVYMTFPDMPAVFETSAASLDGSKHSLPP
jgi:hypothetical protein